MLTPQSLLHLERNSSMSPPTTSDLIFSEQANHNFSKTLGALKRSTLSIHNRLRSIEEDAAFARRVQAAYSRPLIANERCGSWYIEPSQKAGSAYFKSTDGHTGVWKFSSRRLNLQLLEVIGKNDGCIIVDSTRRGKRMPDALSKTIPIWCSVVNRVLFPTNTTSHQLYTPPQVVSGSEHSQISALLPSFHNALQALNLPLAELKHHIAKPLRPMWVTPDSNLTPTNGIFTDCHLVICCTVSRRVIGGEISEGGYIQGAGDDTENWALGLTPTAFWTNRQILLTTSETDLPVLINTLNEDVVSKVEGGGEARCVKPTSALFIAKEAVLRSTSVGPAALIIALSPVLTDKSAWRSSPRRLDIGIGPHKIGSRKLRSALPFIASFVREALTSESVLDLKIAVVCESGKDLSVGVALALLCLFFTNEGQLSEGTVPQRFDKAFIRARLGWLSTAMPDANPNRTTLQSVNSFLMERPK
ncbi:tRNA a64-2'-o-ribosylphosphate transferas-like protein [Amylocarpus encephaloides]|uniref:tRNA a64-2'-o-ribosylphosphate transferas-like protein n=1 Tax=Amylocarpus encephaloides TaxID=45428 RepID=A0A9P7YLQ0_9HELO|nr:tRNA a64-2'-o-ribosylphosphate transferas-like protein [Amylocarpus encephaloides]